MGTAQGLWVSGLAAPTAVRPVDGGCELALAVDGEGLDVRGVWSLGH